MKKKEKTNVMRVLDSKKIKYNEYYYGDTEAVSGVDVAKALGQNPESVFKTLVTTGKSGEHYVFMVPVAEELDLKKAAKAVGEKSIAMLKSKELLGLTGYIHGGCSPIGMKKLFKTTIHKTASDFDTILFSGGKIGFQVEIPFEDLKKDLTEVIYRCVDIKRIVVEHDQFDTGERMLLNFGHTLAHTIEQHYHYTRESHGEAVAIGMYQITKIAEEKGLTTSGCAEQIKKALEIYKLPDNSNLPIDVLTDAISLDKKNLNNHLNVVLLHDIGDSYVYPTDVSFFDGAGIV